MERAAPYPCPHRYAVVLLFADLGPHVVSKKRLGLALTRHRPDTLQTLRLSLRR